MLFCTIISQRFIEIFLNAAIFENDESDDNDLENIVLIENINRIRGKRQIPPRITGFVENVIPRYNNQQFRRHFRMKPEIFENLENRLGPLLFNPEALGRPAIPIRTQLLATI